MGNRSKNAIPMEGKTFGRLTVIKHAYTKKTSNWVSYWLCKCECGNLKEVKGSHLREGLISSCGCLLQQIMTLKKTTHGLSKERVYNIWSKMLARCAFHNSNSNRYHRYAGRGITVCERWLKFENFISDMGYPPSKAHSIDRINNDGNYEPKNCRWATNLEQCNNRKSRKGLKRNQRVG